MRERRLDLGYFRQRLEEEKRKHRVAMHNIDQRLAGKGPFAEGAEAGQDLDEHQGDAATENMERQTDLAYHSEVQEILNQIEVALRKLEEGNYGVCDRCREAIPERRLRAIPWANLCVSCQGKTEPS